MTRATPTCFSRSSSECRLREGGEEGKEGSVVGGFGHTTDVDQIIGDDTESGPAPHAGVTLVAIAVQAVRSRKRCRRRRRSVICDLCDAPHGARQHPDPIAEQGTVGRIVGVGLDDRGVDVQLPALDDALAPRRPRASRVAAASHSSTDDDGKNPVSRLRFTESGERADDHGIASAGAADQRADRRALGAQRPAGPGRREQSPCLRLGG